MSNPPTEVLQMARQGHPDAIATLINRHLETRGIIAYVAQQDDRLQVILESATAPNQADLVPYVTRGIKGLDLAHIHHLTISGKQQGNYASDWTEDLTLGTGLGIAPLAAAPVVNLPPAPPMELDELDQLLTSQDGAADVENDPLDLDLDLERELGLVFPDEGDLELSDLSGLDLDLDLDLDQPPDLDLDLGQIGGQTDAVSLDHNLETAANLEASNQPDLNLDFLIDQDSLSFDSEPGFDFDAMPPVTTANAYSTPTQVDQAEADQAWDLDFDVHPSPFNQASESPAVLDFQQAATAPGEEFDPDLIFTSSVEEPAPQAHPFEVEGKVQNSSGLTWPEDVWDSGDQLSADLPQIPAADLDWSFDSTEQPIDQKFQPETFNLEPESLGAGYQLPLAETIFPPEPDISVPDLDLNEEFLLESDFHSGAGIDKEPDLRDLELPQVETTNRDWGESSAAPVEPPPEEFSAVDFDQNLYGSNLAPGKEQTNGFWPEPEEFAPVSEGADLEAADDFIHKFAPVSDQEVAQFNSKPPANLQALPKILAGVGFGALALVLSWMGFNTFRTVVQQRPETTTVPAPSMPAKLDQGTGLAQADSFRQAVNAATKAANLSQTAKTGAEWQLIVNSWKQAIALMQQVPSDHPRYGVAQTKIGQYQSNLAYAEKNLSRLSAPQ